MSVSEFVSDVMPAALIAHYQAALTTDGADVGIARAAIENEFMQRQREDRKELQDFLDTIQETPGRPIGHRASNFGTRKGGRHHPHDE